MQDVHCDVSLLREHILAVSGDHGELGFAVSGSSPKPSFGDEGLRGPARTNGLVSEDVDRLDLDVLPKGVLVEQVTAHPRKRITWNSRVISSC